MTHTKRVATIVRGEYEWDSGKADANVAKHGVSFVEAADALSDPNEVSLSDPTDPERVHSIVFSPQQRVLYVVTTDLGVRTRIISARKATPHEKRIYAQADR